MATTITIRNVEAILAASVCASREEARFYLQGVYLNWPGREAIAKAMRPTGSRHPMTPWAVRTMTGGGLAKFEAPSIKAVYVVMPMRV